MDAETLQPRTGSDKQTESLHRLIPFGAVFVSAQSVSRLQYYQREHQKYNADHLQTLEERLSDLLPRIR